jgi:hypothetical protein
MQFETLISIIISVVAALLLALFQYFYKAKSSHKKPIYAILRFITYFTVILLLINPKIEKQLQYTQKPSLAVLVDNSESIALLKQKTNVNNILQSLQTNELISTKYDIDYYVFGEEFASLDTLAFQDRQTNIAEAFQNLKQIYANRTAPTLLITDGNQTYGNDFIDELRTYKQDIFTVVVGDTLSYSDLRIEQLNVNKYAFLKNKFPVEIRVLYSGKKEVNSKLQIRSGNSILYSNLINFNNNNNAQTVTVYLEAETIGLNVFEAKILPLSEEKNVQNNSKQFAIEVIDEKTKVAIISDIMHPDLGALKKSIESNNQRSAQILKPSEFVKDNTDFQLAIIYQPTVSFQNAFKKLEQNKINKFIISGTQTQWAFLNSILSNYKQEITNQFEDFQPSLNLSYSVFNVNTLSFDDYPPLKSEFGTLGLTKAYQTILFKSKYSTPTSQPMLLTFEEDKYREALLMGEGIWRWRAQCYLDNNSFEEFDNFMSKLIQYLASKKRRDRLVMEYEPFYLDNQDIEISAQYFNKNYEFNNQANLEIAIKNDSTNAVLTLPLINFNTNYSIKINNLEPGDYSFSLTADNEIKRSGKFKVLAYNVEKQFMSANLKKLKTISTNEKGQLYIPDNYSLLIENLANNDKYKGIQKSIKKVVPLIEFKYLLALLALSLAMEWLIRKYNGLI